MPISQEFWTADIYCAATLDCFGIPFLRVAPLPDGKIGFYFDNTDDKAWQTAQEYRTDGWLMVPVLKFKGSFRFLSRESHKAAQQATRTRETDNDNDNAA